MDPQAGRPNALLKSKSLNTRVRPRVDEKKSKSSGEFQSLLVKKRGVYVEKRATSPGPYQPQVESPKVKAPPRARPGAKPFLDSVLTILSKTTTSTQYPNRTPKMSKVNQPKTRVTEDDDLDLWLLEQSAAVKKPKHKKGEQSPKLKRDSLSPDLHHSKEKFKRNLAIHVSEEVREESKIDLGTNLEIKVNVEGNRNLEKESVDPVTLVKTAAKDEKLYSLFVNLLETVYNVKTDEETPGKKSIKMSKTKPQKDDLLKEKESKRDGSPTDKLFINSRFAKVIPQPFDSKWRENELEENMEESTHDFGVGGKPSQTNEFEEEVNEERYTPRSQTLTNEVYKELPERVVALKSKPEFRNNVTSSTSKDSDRSSDVAVNTETGEAIQNDNTFDVENSIARSVMEGNRLNMAKKTDPTTTSGPEKEKKLYSLFVNLLESVYPDLQTPELFDEVSSQSSKLQFEIEVNAAKRLNEVAKQTKEHSQPPCLRCTSRDEWRPRDQVKNRYEVKWSYLDDESKAPERRVRKKVKRYVNKYESAEQRVPYKQRSLRKKNKKQELLAVIKQQLMKQDNTYKEPATFYDALRIMARNRRREYNDANFIRRAQDIGDDSEYDSSYRFKKRKVARNPRARPMRYPKADNHAAPASARFKFSHSEYKPPSNEAESTAPPDSDDSYHSLAVYGYDYFWNAHPSESSSSSGEIVDYEVSYNWQSTVGSQCCNN